MSNEGEEGKKKRENNKAKKKDEEETKLWESNCKMHLKIWILNCTSFTRHQFYHSTVVKKVAAGFSGTLHSVSQHNGVTLKKTILLTFTAVIISIFNTAFYFVYLFY
jgi:hypothetical protein